MPKPELPDPHTRAVVGQSPALAKSLQPVYEAVRGMLPPGTHFALLVEVPGTTVVGVTTDRNVMAPLAGEWFLSALAGAKG